MVHKLLVEIESILAASLADTSSVSGIVEFVIWSPPIACLAESCDPPLGSHGDDFVGENRHESPS